MNARHLAAGESTGTPNIDSIDPATGEAIHCGGFECPIGSLFDRLRMEGRDNSDVAVRKE
ncbi:hypothetical protein QYH69_20160 [Paraburkholderia sp. SARCC-3016]|uniref:hypothetical protein n=1 Tax=Paraburkholderia sp. SARCC-3016 TaxID=3058611 RepID=UPI0028089BA8|nr:hypothetical protein [Paraburkholderia sp. SARCC-3016]MDQ7979564.1 hypothetical protein [Paraburkholderia sp. SARCC-3016]